MYLWGFKEMILSERKLVAVNWFINNLNPHRHDDIFVLGRRVTGRNQTT